MSNIQEKLEKIKEELKLVETETINKKDIETIMEINKQINELWNNYQNKDTAKKKNNYNLILETVTKKLQNLNFKLYRFSGYELSLLNHPKFKLDVEIHDNFSRSEVIVELILSDKKQDQSIKLYKTLKINCTETTEQEIDYYSDLIIETIIQKNIELIQQLGSLSNSISNVVLSIIKR